MSCSASLMIGGRYYPCTQTEHTAEGFDVDWAHRNDEVDAVWVCATDEVNR